MMKNHTALKMRRLRLKMYCSEYIFGLQTSKLNYFLFTYLLS